MRRFTKTCLLTGVLIVAGAADLRAQVSLQMSKSGNDVVLSWTGGSGTYDVIRSSAFRMSANTDFLQTGTTGTGFTDTGALLPDRNPPLYCYVITDVAAGPALNITTPCDSPPGGPPCTATTTARSAIVGGTTNSTTPAYVNDLQAATAAGSFTASGVSLFLGVNVITAATRSVGGDWAIDYINIDRLNGNHAPVIAVTTPSDGTTIYDPTPFVQVDYSDPEGSLVTGDLRIYIDGADRTGSFTVSAAQATYQLLSGEALAAGSHFIYATIRDVAPYSASAASHFVVSNPTIDSFSPAAEGKIGDTITISGAGFDPTPANNTVTFNGVSASVTGATSTTLTVVVPAGAETGLVVATVDGRSSRGKVFRVLLATGFISISSVAVNPSVSSHVFFTDRSTNDKLYEILPSGTVQDRCTLNEATGLPVDSSGNLYYGLGLSGGILGQLDRYLPGSTTCETYVATTKLIGESNASVFGAALSEVGGLNLYTADNDNGKIKRIDPAKVVTAITAASQLFTNPTGMATTSTGTTLYFSSGNNIRSLPIPGGGTPALVKSLAGGPKGLAITPDDKLVVARSSASVNTVGWYDPSSSSNPFWDLAGGLSSPQVVALGDPLGSPFIVVGEATRVFRAPRPTVLLSDASDQPLPVKVVADFAPGTTDCLGANVVTLKAKFGPATLVPDTTPRQLLTWTVADPDDPSDDLAVDPNGSSGGDNLQTVGSYNQWEAVAGYAMTGAPTASSVQTEIVGGVSQIRFHLSCQPGDNYHFVGQVSVPVYGALEETTDTLTLWRRLHVESDSMGPGGPLESDDAAVDDVPEALLTLLANAFRPAYIEVALPPDTGQNTPDVRFKNNVDSNSSLAIADQGRLGRATSSTPGYWVTYPQGGYEGALGNDNDPDAEDGIDFGVTNAWVPGNGGRYSLTFSEAIRDATAESGIDTEYQNTVIALHEIGHQFGLGHAVGCVMDAPPFSHPVFCGSEIRAIRSVQAPSTNDTP